MLSGLVNRIGGGVEADAKKEAGAHRDDNADHLGGFLRRLILRLFAVLAAAQMTPA